MANLLKMADVQAIVALFQQGWSKRRIARELGIDRETVARYTAPKPAISHTGSEDLEAGGEAKPAIPHTGSSELGGDDSGAGQERVGPKPAIVHIGSDGVSREAETAKPAISHTGSDVATTGLAAESGSAAARADGAGRQSECVPFRTIVEAKLDQGLSAQRIWQDLKADHGFTHSYYSVLRFVSRLQPGQTLPFRRLERAPGEEAQIDFGTGAPIVAAPNEDPGIGTRPSPRSTPRAKRQRTHVFRIVLSHSRKAYSEAVTRQTTDAFLACLENAFAHFGGVPKTLVIDNLKAAVTRADWFDPDLNPKVAAFCQHYGTVMLPTKPYVPRHKGKVERGIDYVQENALKGRKFATLAEQNRFLLDWERTVADTRIHGTTRRQVGKHFADVEKATLLPLPAERFPNFREARRTVHRDGHVEVERAYYSVPPEYVGRTVWARWDGRLVRVFNERFELVATHARHLPGSFSTLDVHLHSAKISKVELGASQLLARADQLGPNVGQWAQAMIRERGVEGIRPLVGLLGLANKFPIAILDDACAAAHRHGAYRLRFVRQLAKRRQESHDQQPSNTPLLDEHPLIRPLVEYGRLVTASAWDAGFSQLLAVGQWRIAVKL